MAAIAKTPHDHDYHEVQIVNKRGRKLDRKSPPVQILRHQRGSAFRSAAKRVVLCVYSRLCQEQPNERKAVLQARTSELTSVSVRSIQKMRAENKRGVLKTPGKKHPSMRGRNLRMERMDDIQKVAIRRVIHSFFRKNVQPTLANLKEAMDDDDSLPHVCMETVRRIIHDLGFKYQKYNKKAFLIENYDIQIWRVRYLHDITRFRLANRPIFYLDETWINCGHTNEKGWFDSTIENHQDGPQHPTSRSGRFVIAHIGSQQGFLDGGLHYFRSTGTDSFRKEMNSTVFETWFMKILEKLPRNSVIVMDDAPCHSVKMFKVPTMSWKKEAVINWLNEHAIAHQESALKVELISIVEDVKHRFKGYKVDAMATAAGHTILRLPPFHCELNPIEMVWSQVKEYVVQDSTFRAPDDEKLLLEGVLSVTPENWKSYCNQVLQLEEEWQVAHHAYEQHQELVINNAGDSSTSASDESATSDDDDIMDVSDD